ncbi:MAG TPA: amino acid permease [Kofleriaceae bacterium]|nr:amino acid permease [Kofleriaceae bacterium]
MASTEPHAAPPDEHGLSRQLSSGQQTMMALGGAVGTGLFLASGLAVKVAGPAVLVSYVLVACVALLLGRALSEMAVAHPTAGAFGVYAGMYLSPFAGYAVRVSYWLMEVIATGAQLVAAATYMKFWMPAVPGAFWVIGFAIALLYVNSREIGKLGAIEYWLVMLKVVAVVLFVGLGIALLVGATGEPAIGLGHLTAHGGFAPFGVRGIGLGCCFVIYSFIGVEIVGVTSGEASDPARTIPAAMRRIVFGLSAIYLVTIAVLTALMPWNELAGATESPFVSVLARIGIPAVASIMNFVVLSAALSSANANLYLISRTLFSLARAGFAPRAFGTIAARGAPLNALLASSVGLGVAALVRALSEHAYEYLFGVALFGALFVWLMIFVTHIVFRRGRPPLGSFVGAAAIVAMLLATHWLPGLESTLWAGGPWFLVLAIGYAVSVYVKAGSPRGRR